MSTRSTGKPPAEPLPPGDAAAPAAGSVQSVGMAFAVLEQLAQTPGAVGTSELARRLGETKARVHRHLSTLRTLGFVQKDAATDGYRLGWKGYRLGMSLVENFGLRKLAHRHLLRLHHESGQTVALAMAAGGEMTVLDAIQSTGDIAITIRAGSSIPVLSAALGRAVLAFQDPATQALALAPAVRPGHRDAIDSRRLAQALESVRERWYELASGERLPGVAALAAPIFDDRGEPIGSVGVIGSAAVITEPVPATLLKQVQDAARQISEELGSNAWSQARVARRAAAPSRKTQGN